MIATKKDSAPKSISIGSPLTNPLVKKYAPANILNQPTMKFNIVRHTRIEQASLGWKPSILAIVLMTH